MNYSLIIGIQSGFCLLMIVLFFLYRNKVKKEVDNHLSLQTQIEKNKERLRNLRTDVVESTNKLKKIKQDIAKNEEKAKDTTIERARIDTEHAAFLSKNATQQKQAGVSLKTIIDTINTAKKTHEKINNETTALQNLKADKDKMAQELDDNLGKLNNINTQISNLSIDHEKAVIKKQELMSLIDLYSRMEMFTSQGHFEEPSYLYETSARFVEEIKRVRQKQKEHIKDKTAVTYPQSLTITSDSKTDKKILTGQVNLMLSSFNVDCDFLIGKVKPSSFTRTLEQIDNLSTKLEKSAATLHCGFNTEYVKLKFDECKLQYQHSLKKQDEKEEQRLIKERMREEVKAQKEYERAIVEAEKEEKMYRKMLKKAKEALTHVSEDERIITQQRIEDLEQQLAEAIAKEERAKSLAEQTRKGHVYVISNVGSFGENVYKIGLTRRLDPMDRVKELGDASVPFRFDVHAIIHAEDAPALESALHRKFKEKRINAVNFRKEFFRTDLIEIKNAVDEIVDNEIDFKMTALAEEFYESKRLRGGLVA